MKVINQARTDFEYRYSSDYPIVKETLFSNKVVTNIICERLDSKKCTNKRFATLFDILTYTVTITNIGKIRVHNVYFQDLLPISLKFIKNSLIIDGDIKIGEDPKRKIRIGDIEPGKTRVIKFKAILLNIHISKYIKNYGTIYFDYKYDVTEPPIILEQNTNMVITIVRNKLFKQFNLESTINIPYCGRSVRSINNLKVNINIINYKTIKTTIKKVEDNEESELSKIIIVGSIKYEIIYRYINKLDLCNKYNKNPLNYAILNYTDGFSISLLVPNGVEFIEDINIDIYIENVMVNIVNNSIYINSDLLLNIK